jgi:hypothetical protein
MTDTSQSREADVETPDLEAIRRQLLSRLGAQQDLPAARMIIEAVLDALREAHDD